MVPDTPLAVCLAGPRSAAHIAASSCGGLDRALTAPAELAVAIAGDEATVLGAFQRATSEGSLRRASGGPAVRVGPGTVHVALALATPSALVPCEARQIVNRYVRPLLRALTRHGHLAHYFGRDWISVAHRPAGWVGFAHDAGTGRTLFEAFVAVSTPFALAQRESFLGKPHATLEELRRGPVDATELAVAIADTYAVDAVRGELAWPAGTTDASRARPEPPWAVTVEEAIGTLGAGPDAAGTFRVGGDLLVSRDALARLEARAATAPRDDLARIVDETLAARGVALDGVKSLASVLDVVTRARAG
jgi:hypothetical protein